MKSRIVDTQASAARALSATAKARKRGGSAGRVAIACSVLGLVLAMFAMTHFLLAVPRHPVTDAGHTVLRAAALAQPILRGARVQTAPLRVGMPKVLLQGVSPAMSAVPGPPVWNGRDAGGFTFDELLAHWESETTDPEWSNNVRSYIYAMLETDDLQADIVRHVDCREALCRIQFDGANMDALLHLQNVVQGDRYPYSQRFVNVDGRGVTEVMIARDSLINRVFPRR